MHSTVAGSSPNVKPKLSLTFPDTESTPVGKQSTFVDNFYLSPIPGIVKLGWGAGSSFLSDTEALRDFITDISKSYR